MVVKSNFSAYELRAETSESELQLRSPEVRGLEFKRCVSPSPSNAYTALKCPNG